MRASNQVLGVVVLLVAPLVLGASPVRAQTPCAPAAQPAGPGAIALATNAELKSPSTALWSALGVTLGSVVLGGALMPMFIINPSVEGIVAAGSLPVLGLTVGPSIGHFYVGEVKRGVVMTLIRFFLTGSAAALFAFGGVLSAVTMEHGERPGQGTGMMLIALGAIFWSGATGLAIWDIVDAPRAARRFNERQRKVAWSVAPLVASGGQDLRYGLAVVGRF